MPAIELVIFDCDGTLMDTEPLAAAVETELLAELGIEMSADEFLARFAGTSSDFVIQTIEAEHGRSIPDDHFAKGEAAMVARFRRDAKAMAGAHAMLDHLDCPRAVASNSKGTKLEAALRKGDLWDRFRPYIYSTKDLDGVAEKPASDVFTHIAREFDTRPEATLVVEDSVSGVTGAKAAGCRVVGFTGGSHSRPGHADRLTDAGAETCIDALVAVPELVRVFGEWDPVAV